MFNVFNGNLTSCELFTLQSKFLQEETTSYLIYLGLSLHILIYTHERSPTSLICKSSLMVMVMMMMMITGDDDDGDNTDHVHGNHNYCIIASWTGYSY